MLTCWSYGCSFSRQRVRASGVMGDDWWAHQSHQDSYCGNHGCARDILCQSIHPLWSTPTDTDRANPERQSAGRSRSGGFGSCSSVAPTRAQGLDVVVSRMRWVWSACSDVSCPFPDNGDVFGGHAGTKGFLRCGGSLSCLVADPHQWWTCSEQTGWRWSRHQWAVPEEPWMTSSILCGAFFFRDAMYFWGLL